MGLQSFFKTDADLETKGIEIEYPGVRFRVARAGGANKRFTKLLDRKTKPFRRAIQSGHFTAEQSDKLLREVYAETVVLGIEYETPEGWVPGIQPQDIGEPEGDMLPVSVENVCKLFEYLPDLFSDVVEQTKNSTLFQELGKEEAAKN